ncbi:MAG: DUF86 domain-containing protein [Chloroflexi bacterium]|nr:DUF86 domain-containing protein [Chloroflexota bacterium]
MARRDRDKLAEIIAHAETAMSSSATVSDLRASEMVTDAVRMHLGQIGELARADRVSRVTQGAIPSVPWPELRGMRNRIFHDSGNVDGDVVIDIVETDLPHLVAAIAEVLRQDELT